MNMKKIWKKTLSVLLLAALLCALPGALAWADDGATDVGAIQSDGPTGTQTGGDSGQTAGSGSGTGGADSGGTAESGTSTGGGSETTGTTGGTGSGTAETGGTTTEPGASETPENQGGSGSDLPTVIVDSGGTVSVPDATPTTSPEVTPTTSPAPTASPSPSPTATPAPTPSLPVVTKDPTDETVDIGGDCWFIAKYSNALYAVWHFVSPDGKTDYSYNDPAVATAFPGLKIENGDQSNLHLSSIPAEMNGWRAYCEYRNNSGSTRTNTTSRGA